MGFMKCVVHRDRYIMNIPLNKSVNNTIAELPSHSQVSKHPVEKIQKTHAIYQHENKKKMLAKVYGAHVPIRMTMEENLIKAYHSPIPGQLHKKNVALDILLNKDDTIEFSDYMNQYQEKNKYFDIHTAMEQHYDEN